MPGSLCDNNLLDCSNIVEINEIIACEQALSPKALWQQGEKHPRTPGNPRRASLQANDIKVWISTIKARSRNIVES